MINLLGAIAKSDRSFVMSVRLYSRPSAWKNSVPTVRIVMKFDISVFF